MKTFWTVLCLTLLINALAVLGFAGWMWSSGRLNRQRLQKIVAIVSPTPAQEKQREEEEKRKQEDEERLATDEARIQAMLAGPATVQEKLANMERLNQMLLQQRERLEKEKEDIQRQMENAREYLFKQKAEIEAIKKALDEESQREMKLRDDRNFKQAVEMYEMLEARAAKEHFLKMLAEDRVSQAVDYLAAMQPRKAGALLNEFKTPDEIAKAAELLQRLRQRGIDLLPGTSIQKSQVLPLPAKGDQS